MKFVLKIAMNDKHNWFLTLFWTIIPDGMNFDPVKCVKDTFSRAGYAYRMNFDPPARRHICSGDSQITCLKWSLVHFQIAAKMNFAPLSYQWLHRKSKVDQSSFFEQFQSGPNFILNTWSKNSLMPRRWIKIHLVCISYTWLALLHTLYWIKIHTLGYENHFFPSLIFVDMHRLVDIEAFDPSSKMS